MVVHDTMKHAQFKGALFVPWPPLTRFYAAAPVVSAPPDCPYTHQCAHQCRAGLPEVVRPCCTALL